MQAEFDRLPSQPIADLEEKTWSCHEELFSKSDP